MSKVVDIDKGYNNLKKALAKAGVGVDVGYWYGKIKKKGGADLATVARANEYGVGTKNKGLQLIIKGLGGSGRYIPERSFMRSTYDQNIDALFRYYEKVLRIDIKRGTNNAPKKTGAELTSMIKKKIDKSKSWAVPNAPATIKKKKSDHPLFDTGQLRNKIDFKVVAP